MHIWLLHGYAGSGKDTAGTLLKDMLPNSALTSFAAAVKDEVAAMYELDRTLLDTQAGKQKWLYFADGSHKQVRTLLIEHGEGQKRIHGNPAFWAERVQKPECQNWIFTDWRFLAELETLRRRFPDAAIHTVRIHRPDIETLATPTEHELDAFPSEFMVENSGSLLFLANQLRDILEHVASRVSHN
jgi:hypothetical protein